MRKILPAIVVALFFVACSGDHKKVVVMSKGKADIDLNAGTIKSTDGAGHEEKTLDINSKTVSFKLNTPAGEATVDLLENGLYVVNVKNDTIIGSYQKYVAANESGKTITQEELKQKIDSLILLSEGKNVTAENRNFFILPNHAAKISPNKDAEVVGPYHRMRSAEKIDGKDPEIYRFYSIKEIRETIANLQALTVAKE